MHHPRYHIVHAFVFFLFKKFVPLFFLLFGILSTRADAQDPVTFPKFYLGERLFYKVSWFGISAGTAIISASETTFEGKKAILFKGELKSAKWFSRIYYIEDSVDSIVDPETLRPLVIEVNSKEGKKDRKKNTYTFDYAQNKVISSENKGPIDLPKDFVEMFGIFYFFRIFDFKLHENMEKIVSDGKKFYHVEAKRIGTKTISTESFGMKECTEIQPSQIRLDLFGIKQKPSNISLFLTEDPQRLPVLVQGEIKIGDLVAELEKVESS